MSFLPAYITSSMLPPLPAHLLATPSAGDPRLVVKVTPLRRSSFAGEVFQAQITFTLEEPASTSAEQPPDDGAEAQAAAAAGNLLRRPSAPATPAPSSSSGGGSGGEGPSFKPTHRSAQSLSNPFIPSLHPPAHPTTSPARSASASHAQRKVSSAQLPAGHPHARKPSFAPLPNGVEGGSFSAVEVPTMSSLRRTSAGSVTAAAAPKSPMTPLSSILEGESSSRAAGAVVEVDENEPVADVGQSPSGARVGASPGPRSSPATPTRPNGHRYRSSLSIGHGPPPLASAPAPSEPAALPSPPAESTPGLTITWSHVQLQATLTPSPQHFPPEALLPLRQALLESSTLGSGSLPSSSTTIMGDSADSASSSSAGGWFSLPPPPRHARAPSLTSSLFGIAKTMWSGAGVENTGSLEEERRRMWERTVKEIPVFETLKSVCGVGLELKPARAEKDAVDPLSFTYSVPLPSNLPPTFKGKALKISYALIITVEIEYPLPPIRPGYDNEAGPRKRRTKAVTLKVPVNVWGGIDEPISRTGYDLMQPTIQRTQTASTERTMPAPKAPAMLRGVSTDALREWDQLVSATLPATKSSFLSYATHLFSTLPPREAPFPPADSATSSTRPEKHKHTRSQALSPSTFTQTLPEVHVNGRSAAARAEGERERARRMERLASLDQADERDSEDVVDDLLRASKKASYDIEKEGEVVAVLTLVKSAYRLGETVSGVVTFNQPSCTRRVLKFSAYLQTHEVVPASLHAPTGPKLKPFVRTHASCHSFLTPQTTRVPFSLDLDAPASALGSILSPSFHLRAGEPAAAARPGGLHWKVHVSFLVSAPSRSQPKSVDVIDQSAPDHMLAADAPPAGDQTHEVFRPTPSIAPVVRLQVRDQDGKEGEIWQEMRTEVVECDVDLAMFAPSRLGLAALSVGGGEPGGALDDGAATFVI